MAVDNSHRAAPSPPDVANVNLQSTSPTTRPHLRPTIFARLHRRYLDVLGSIYIYNEHRGYRSLDRVLEAVRARCPDDKDFIAEVEKHRADEQKHYVMFRRYFEHAGHMPYSVDRTCGHIDRLIKLTFGCQIDDLDTAAVVADGQLFNKLCRIIMLTEIRGMRMVDVLLKSPLLTHDRALIKIFKVVDKDEPSHWMPYMAWLKLHDGGEPRLSERLADFWVHLSLVLFKLPILFCNPRLPRRKSWQHEDDPTSSSASAILRPPARLTYCCQSPHPL